MAPDEVVVLVCESLAQLLLVGIWVDTRLHPFPVGGLE